MARRRTGAWKRVKKNEEWKNTEAIEGRYNFERLIIKSNKRGAWTVFTEVHVNGEDFSKIRDMFGTKKEAVDFAHDFKQSNPYGSDPSVIEKLVA